MASLRLAMKLSMMEASAGDDKKKKTKGEVKGLGRG